MQGVKVAAICDGMDLEEHAVGANMGRFKNDVNIILLYPFRVVITTPDTNGNTIFCGVVCHFEFVSLDELDLTLLLADDLRCE
jgi:hypothetical protein